MAAPSVQPVSALQRAPKPQVRSTIGVPDRLNESMCGTSSRDAFRPCHPSSILSFTGQPVPLKSVASFELQVSMW
jgi:hypothetical protein